jgi:hypothetical protein
MISCAPADLERFLAEDDGKPVTMLNLLRFKPDGGRDRYRGIGAAAFKNRW